MKILLAIGTGSFIGGVSRYLLSQFVQTKFLSTFPFGTLTVNFIEAIVFEAKKQGLSGATVTRGIMGFGANSTVHTTKLFEISSDLPLIIEIVDTEEKIKQFTKTVEQWFEQTQSGGLITIEKAEVIRYRAGNNKK